MWTLYICTAVTWGLCDRIIIVDYPTKELCYENIELVLKNSADKPSTILCSPKKEDKK